MKCPCCGYNLPDDANFCASCGTNVSVASSATAATATSTEGSGDVAQSTTAPHAVPNNAESGAPEAPDSTNACGKPAHFGSSIGNSFSVHQGSNEASHVGQFLTTKKGKGIVAGAIAAVAAIIVAAVVGFNMANNVPEDTVRQALQNSSTVADGIVASDYVTAQPYDLKNLKIDKQEDESTGEIGAAITGSNKARHVYFSGSMENDFFKTDFTGEAYYVKQGDTWVSLLGPSITGNTTTPLQGVGRISEASESDDYEISNFSSTLDSSNGAYTSTATQDVSYTFWFATAGSPRAMQRFPTCRQKRTSRARSSNTPIRAAECSNRVRPIRGSSSQAMVKIARSQPRIRSIGSTRATHPRTHRASTTCPSTFRATSLAQLSTNSAKIISASSSTTPKTR